MKGEARREWQQFVRDNRGTTTTEDIRDMYREHNSNVAYYRLQGRLDGQMHRSNPQHRQQNQLNWNCSSPSSKIVVALQLQNLLLTLKHFQHDTMTASQPHLHALTNQQLLFKRQEP